MSYFDDMEEARHRRFIRALEPKPWQPEGMKKRFEPKKRKAKKLTYTYIPLFPV